MYIKIFIHIALFVLIAAFLNSCSLFQSGNKTEISLHIYFSSHEAGEPIIIIGNSYSDEYKLRYYPVVSVQSSSGDRIAVQMLRWRDLSSFQIDRSLDHSERSAILTIKEAHEEFSYDYVNKRSITSEQTKFETIEYLRTLDGMEIDHVSPHGPYLTAFIDARETDLIRELLDHPNIAEINPNLPVISLDQTSRAKGMAAANDNEVLVGLATVIATDGSIEPNLRVQPGDSVIVSYTQPDGTVHRSRTYIREN